MEPLLFALIPGTLGGLAVAWLIAAVGRRRRAPEVVVPSRPDEGYPVINMANIRVEGVGGLGLVAAVIVVAATDPRIRFAVLIAAVLGAGLAFVLIALRRETGALPSGTDGPDGRLPLGLDRGPAMPVPPDLKVGPTSGALSAAGG
ncbi:MAG: hypothetical protein ABIX28_22405, partial [Vicinamibacterales bacterium]